MKLKDHEFKLSFLGGAGTVTGSKNLIETNNCKVLVDCGLFQGLKDLRNLNRMKLTVDASKLDYLILTHAHLDHCGYLPVLVKNGFKGEIHCTKATFEITKIILLDSAKIQEEDALRANKYHYSKHVKAEPLYTKKDVDEAIKLFVVHDYNEWVILNPDIKFQLTNSGHILGSSLVELKLFSKKVVFSGDLGRSKPAILYPPHKIKNADYIIMESTYGDKNHAEGNVHKELAEIIQNTVKNQGILMIPSFAVERTQELLYFIYQLRESESIPPIKVYLDSPMAINVTNVYDKYQELQNLSKFELNRIYQDVHFISSKEESQAVCLDNKPKIVIAGSGMLEGGRILHYLKHHLGKKNNTLLFTGYQGEGTRGRAILKGSHEIKFFGEYHNVNCNIESIPYLSAHGDQHDILNWLKNIQNKPTKIFLNHGEQHQAESLCVKIKSELNWDVSVPKMNSEYILS